VGFNATRRYRDDKRVDIITLVVGIVVIVAAILWAVGVF
jgi:hypothetical protein